MCLITAQLKFESDQIWHICDKYNCGYLLHGKFRFYQVEFLFIILRFLAENHLALINQSSVSPENASKKNKNIQKTNTRRLFFIKALMIILLQLKTN